MRLIDADLLKSRIMSGYYIYCQENKQDIADAIDCEPTVKVKLNFHYDCSVDDITGGDDQ